MQINKIINQNTISTLKNSNAAKYASKALTPINKGVDKAVEVVGNNKFSDKIVKKLSNSKFGYTHILTIESLILGGFYMFNDAKNKNIEKKQKLPLIVNDGLVTLVSGVLNYTLDGKIKKATTAFTDGFKEVAKPKLIEELGEDSYRTTLDKRVVGIKTFQTMVIFGVIYRYLSPVFITPVANKISHKIQHRNDGKQEAQQPIANANTKKLETKA